MDMFGLGILLNARDQASSSILRVNSALQGLMSSMNEAGEVAETQMSRISSSMTIATQNIERGLMLTSLGSEIASFGTALSQPLVEVGKQALATGSQFEQWRMTLDALYKDSTVAKQKANEAMKLAAETPFEVTDVMEALIGFKAIGAEALTVMDNVEGASDQTRTFLEYVGDLASLRPDVGLNGVLLGIRNLLGGDGGKSLKMRMDIDFEQIMGEDWKDTPEEIMQQIANVSQKIAGGLMTKLEGTWSQMMSNLEDQKTRFFLALADNGAFDSFKNSLKYISDAINKIDDDRMATIGKNIASAFTMIWKPIDFVIKRLTDFGMAIVKLIETSPLISKLVVGFISLASISAIIIGGLVALSGAFLLVKGAILVIQTALASLGPIMMAFKTKIISMGTALVPLLPKIAVLGTAIALLYKGWKSDFGGIRTSLTNFVTNTKTAFTRSTEIANMGVTDMMNALNNLDMNTWTGRLTYNLTKIKVFWTALCDAWNDYELSDENFQKLNALGLLPLLGTILDIKMRAEAFFDGFKQGWKNIFDTVSPIIAKIIEIIGDIASALLPGRKEVEEFQNATDGLNTQPWFDMGEAIAYFTGILGGIWVVSKIAGAIGTIASVISGVVSFIVGIPSAIMGVFSTIWGAITSLGGVIATALGWVGGLVTAILGALGVVVTMPAWLVGLITVAVVAVLALIIKYRDKVWEALKVVGGWIVSGISGLCQLVVGIVTSIALAITGIIMSIIVVVETVVGIIATIIGTLVGIISTIVIGIVGIFSMAFQVISGIFSTLVTIITTLIASLIGIIAPIVAMIVGFFQTGFAVIEAVVRTFCAIAKAIFTGDFTSLAETLKGIWSNLGSKISQIWSNVTNSISTIWNTVSSFISDSWSKLGEKWNSIMSNIKTIASEGVESVKKVWGSISSFFSDLWSGIMSSASSMFSWLSDKFSWVTNSVSAVKNFFSGGSSSTKTPEKMSGNMVGLNTGGYVKTEGVALLHPNEVVVNDDLTQKLRSYLDGEHQPMGRSITVPNIEIQPVVPTVNVEIPNLATASMTRLGDTHNNTNNTVMNTNNEDIVNNYSNVTNREEVYKSVSNVHNTSNSTKTTNKTSNSDKIDNSITFSEGAIQITMTNGNDADIDKLVRTIAEKLKKEANLRSTLNYKPVLR